MQDESCLEHKTFWLSEDLTYINGYEEGAIVSFQLS